MAISIKLADANFTNRIARALPHLDDAVGVFLFGGSVAQSARNLAPGANGASGTWTTGNPTVGANYADMDANSSLDTGIVFTGDNMTIISVSEFNHDNSSSMVASDRHGFHISGSNNDFRVYVNASQFAMTTTISLNVPYFQGATSGPNGGTDVGYLGQGGSFITGSMNAASVTGSTNISFGTRNGKWIGSGPFDEKHRHYMGLIFDRVLTSTEMADVYGWAAEYLAARGVVVV